MERGASFAVRETTGYVLIAFVNWDLELEPDVLE